MDYTILHEGSMSKHFKTYSCEFKVEAVQLVKRSEKSRQLLGEQAFPAGSTGDLWDRRQHEPQK